MNYRTYKEWKDIGYIVKKGEHACKVTDDYKPEYLFSEEQVTPLVKEIDCKHTQEIICPYCGNEFRDSWEYGDDGEVYCEECNHTFSYIRDVTVTYNSYKEEGDE